MCSIRAVLRLLVDRFGPVSSSSAPPTRDETKLAGEIANLLLAAEKNEFDVEKETLLDLDDVEGDPSWNCDDTEVVYDANSNPLLPTVTFSQGTHVPVDRVQKALASYRSTKKGSRPLESMNKDYRFIKTSKDIETLLKYEKDEKALYSRLALLSLLKTKLKEHVWAKFNDGITLHDEHIRAMALDINKEVGVPDFKASASWITRFKKSVGVCSRHITTFVSRRNFRNRDQIEANAKEFVEKIRELMEMRPLSSFVNCDQSGFNKELIGNRTLAIQGEKIVTRMVQSTNATTHSYTILPMLFADGRLGPVLFIQLQEPKGVFPQRGHFMADNIYVVAGTSHIMTKKSMIDWFKNVVVPTMGEELVLIVDSWSSFKDHETLLSLVPEGKSMRIENLPPGTTSIGQPSDVFLFRQLKTFIRKISDFVRVFQLPFNLSERDNILKLMSLVYRQFCAPRFSKYLRFSWHKAGYVDEHPGEFETPDQFCFNLGGVTTCGAADCDQTSFIICSYCNTAFCFDDFVVKYHNCC